MLSGFVLRDFGARMGAIFEFSTLFFAERYAFLMHFHPNGHDVCAPKDPADSGSGLPRGDF